MLRILVIALLLANVTLVGFELLQPDRLAAAEQAADIQRDEPPTLQLFSEMSEPEQQKLGHGGCFTAGPFESEAEKEAARRLIGQSAKTLTERQTTATVNQGVWVYLPVQPDYVTARNMSLTLRDAGFPDAVVIDDGEWRNAVSLGYFLDERNAQHLFDEVRSLGFPVKMRQQEMRQPHFWIDYVLRDGAAPVADSGDGPIPPAMQRAIPCSD
jgi:hypothetical protein